MIKTVKYKMLWNEELSDEIFFPIPEFLKYSAKKKNISYATVPKMLHLYDDPKCLIIILRLEFSFFCNFA